jgi:hypothetical protein
VLADEVSRTLKTRLRSSINHRLLQQYKRYRAQGLVDWWAISKKFDRIRQRLVCSAAGNGVKDEQVFLVGFFWEISTHS